MFIDSNRKETIVHGPLREYTGRMKVGDDHRTWMVIHRNFYWCEVVKALMLFEPDPDGRLICGFDVNGEGFWPFPTVAAPHLDVGA